MNVFPQKIEALTRGLIAMCHDLTAVGVAWIAAYWIRFNLAWPIPYLDDAMHTLPFALGLHGTAFVLFGLYRGVWRYASITDLKRIGLSVLAGTVLISAAAFLARFEQLIPRAVLVLHPMLLFLLMGSARIGYRIWREGHLVMPTQLNAEPVLVVGAGGAGARLALELESNRMFRIVGFLDDDLAKAGRSIRGVRVLGPIDSLPDVAHKFGVEQVIISIPSATHQTRRRIAALCDGSGLHALTVPTLDDLVAGKVSISRIRHVELDDLLGRDPVVLDDTGLHGLIGGRVIMVTGAGGSIGSELCRQIARFRPSRMVFLELSEFALYGLEEEFRSRWPDIPIMCAIGDVKHESRVREIIAREKPSLVYHAAAYKHVPMMEIDNAWEAVRNNVLGTFVVANASAQQGVERFIFVSTDKAVNPTSVMGATKRLAEIMCQVLQASSSTRFLTVRFGNVLGSAGSVIPKFREQIAKGGPVTVTHPEITRYFMSIPEAAQLVLQGSLMGRGGEIFVLDMGEPVKIVDLARDLIRLSGVGEDEVKIVFTGLRPGEKLYEEVLANDEQTLPTPHPKLRIARARSVEEDWLAGLLAWLGGASLYDDRQVRAALKDWIPEYSSPDLARQDKAATPHSV